ncbi:sulfate ABC transporter permease subunit CysT [Flavimobilis sp. GY10621]|uniref:Sulfate transport system permease protein CysT n=1 Tax=Flavimobilis rhizosphaerae TaxID=2775421 RepID=A0ABR9DLG3_9MICO|nr:sulfate ABC transporter permease subunit CysT [Flavimobilis rhizosphaerae]MBD9697987.1 sulfate ABC transporter permease subunit CysT [Flavimobilis rhizosphaerae]
MTTTLAPADAPASPAGTAAPRPRRPRRSRGPRALTPASRVGLGVGVLWFSILALIPLVAVVVETSQGGWDAFARALTTPQTAAAIRLTVLNALGVTVLNAVMGTVIAWVLVRDPFPGRRILEIVIDIPFALPTIVAGLVLLTLYGPTSPVGVNVANTQWSVTLALAFVTLPFVVRTVQPVLAELDRDVEEAAASLGARPFTVLRRIVLPALVPAIAAGASLSFARGISEYGSLVLLSGNLPMRTEVASVRILAYLENGDQTSAAAVATVLLGVSLVALLTLDILQRRVVNRGTH